MAHAAVSIIRKLISLSQFWVGPREILRSDNIFMVSHNFYDILLVDDLEKDDAISIASDVFKNNIITVAR